MAYPTTLDSLSTSYLGTDQVSVVDHAGMHNASNTSINALEVKVGINGSAVTTTIDYLLKNISSVDPGHKHSDSSLTSIAWSKVSSTPTTLAGYGISDAIALTTATLAQFAATTSAQLAGVISDETGTGKLVFATSPSLLTGLNMDSGFVMNWASSNATLTHATGTLTLGGAIVPTIFGPASLATNGTQNFFNITGTFPTTPVAGQTGISFIFTTAGNQSFNTGGLFVSLNPGYTGSSPTVTLSFQNTVAGTGANYFTETSNTGVGGITNGSTTAGHNVGGWFNARNGLNNVGVFGRSIVATNSALNIGVFGAAVSGTNFVGGYFGLHSAIPTIAASAALMCDNGAQAVDIQVWRDNGTACMKVVDGGLIGMYNQITTVAWGIPAIYGTGRSTAQTAAVASVTTYTVGAADGSFVVLANANITAFVAGTFNVQVAYTDETNTAQTLTLNFSSLTGTLGVALAATGPFEGIPAHIRCKASTSITIKTTGTFTSLTYNVEGLITQLA